MNTIDECNSEKTQRGSCVFSVYMVVVLKFLCLY